MNTDAIRRNYYRHYRTREDIRRLCDEIDRLNRKIRVMQFLHEQVIQLLRNKRSEQRRAA